MIMVEIVKKIGKDKFIVIVFVDKLVCMGYVIKERSDEDMCVVYVVLIFKGEDFKFVFEEIF